MKVKEIRGIILAGVHRWDESGIDEMLPRALMPVAHVPLICHVLGWLRDAGITCMTLCANSDSRQMRDTLADGSALNLDLEYFEDWTPRGPAGCIRDAAEVSDAERFVVVDATIWPRYDLGAILCDHLQSGAEMTIATVRDFSYPAHKVRLGPVGVYILERSILAHIPATGYQDVKEVLLPQLHAECRRVHTYTLPMACLRLVDADSYLSLNALAVEWLSHNGQDLAGYRRIGQSLVHESARLASTSELIGPVLIGPGTTVAAGVTLIGPTVIGAECVIGRGAAICQSVLWDRCEVGPRAGVNQCLLSDEVAIEPGEALYRIAYNSEQRWRHSPIAPAVLARNPILPAENAACSNQNERDKVRALRPSRTSVRAARRTASY